MLLVGRSRSCRGLDECGAARKRACFLILSRYQRDDTLVNVAEQRLKDAEQQVNMPMAWLIATRSLVNVAEQRLKDTQSQGTLNSKQENINAISHD